MWDLARIYAELNKDEAIAMYSKLLASYQKDEQKNRVNQITLNYFMAKLYAAQGNETRARELMAQVPAEKKLSSLEKERLGARAKRVMEFKSSLGVK
jgi:hypothetical protein